MELHYLFSFLAHQLTNFDLQFFIEPDLTCPDIQSKPYLDIHKLVIYTRYTAYQIDFLY